MATAAEHLAQYGVTVDQARAFILANIQTPSVIFDKAVQFGVTSQMLADVYGGVSAEAVQSFFDARGFNSRELDFEEIQAELGFQSSELEGQTLYSVSQVEPNGAWETSSFHFSDGTVSAGEGLTENPTQYQNNPYEITEEGWLKVYFDIEGDQTLDVIAKVAEYSSPYSYDVLSWQSVENPVGGLETLIPDWSTEANTNNQLTGLDDDYPVDYTFYDMNSALLFIA